MLKLLDNGLKLTFAHGLAQQENRQRNEKPHIDLKIHQEGTEARGSDGQPFCSREQSHRRPGDAHGIECDEPQPTFPFPHKTKLFL